MSLRGQNPGFDPDEARIQAKRERQQALKDRMLNARQRTIGIDREALDQQVQERQRQKHLEKQADRMEVMRNSEISRILEDREAEERDMRRQFNVEVKQTWQTQTMSKRQELEEERAFRSAPALAGPQFAAMDDPVEERKRLQAEQMKRWTDQQIALKQDMREREVEESRRFFLYQRHLDSIREDMEREEEAFRRSLRHDVRQANFELAKMKDGRQRAEKEYQDALDRMEQEYLLSGGTLVEHARDAMDDDGRITRIDHFKGFTEEQRRAILHENERLMAAHRDLKEKEARAEAEWAKQQALLRYTMELAENEEKAMRKHLSAEQLRDLKGQMETERERKARVERERYGVEIGRAHV